MSVAWSARAARTDVAGAMTPNSVSAISSAVSTAEPGLRCCTRVEFGLRHPETSARYMQPQETDLMLSLARVMPDRELGAGCAVPGPRSVISLAGQWRLFLHRYSGHLPLLHVVQCLPVWGPQRDGLPPSAGGFPVPRPGLRSVLAGAVTCSSCLCRSLCRRRQPFCQIVEDGGLRGGVKGCRLRSVYIPPGNAPVASGFAAPLPPLHP
jgi:hypothetical protein